MWLWLAITLIAIVAVGAWRGVRAIVGLVITLGVFGVFLLPALARGGDPVLLAVTACSAVLYLVLFLVHGMNWKTASALGGTLAALSVGTALAWLAIDTNELRGLADENNMQIMLYLPGLSISGLLLAGFIIGTLGVLNDVTVAPASTISELRGAVQASNRNCSPQRCGWDATTWHPRSTRWCCLRRCRPTTAGAAECVRARVRHDLHLRHHGHRAPAFGDRFTGPGRRGAADYRDRRGDDLSGVAEQADGVAGARGAALAAALTSLSCRTRESRRHRSSQLRSVRRPVTNLTSVPSREPGPTGCWRVPLASGSLPRGGTLITVVPSPDPPNPYWESLSLWHGRSPWATSGKMPGVTSTAQPPPYEGDVELEIIADQDSDRTVTRHVGHYRQ